MESNKLINNKSDYDKNIQSYIHFTLKKINYIKYSFIK